MLVFAIALVLHQFSYLGKVVGAVLQGAEGTDKNGKEKGIKQLTLPVFTQNAIIKD